VQDTKGAEFHDNLRLPIGSSIIRKGKDPKIDAYSGFLDSDLEQQLKRSGINRVFVGGLATDFCVLNTVLDARKLGFETYLIEDAVAAVDAEPGGGEQAIQKMKDNGAVSILVAEVTA
jgi:nicotinamidase/pyrazinamidase